MGGDPSETPALEESGSVRGQGPGTGDPGPTLMQLLYTTRQHSFTPTHENSMHFKKKHTHNSRMSDKVYVFMQDKHRFK